MDHNNDVAGPPMFFPHRHPELHQLGRNFIQRFLQERGSYLLRANHAIAHGSSFQPVSLVNSVKTKLLHTLVNYDTFPGVEEVGRRTDVVLLKWLEQQNNSGLQSITLEELTAIVKKEVFMRTSEPDPKLHVISLFSDYDDVLRSQGMEKINTESTELSTGHVCALLRPPLLRKKIEKDLSLNQELRADWKGFVRHVVAKAEALEEFVSCADEPSNRGNEWCL